MKSWYNSLKLKHLIANVLISFGIVKRDAQSQDMKTKKSYLGMPFCSKHWGN